MNKKKLNFVAYALIAFGVVVECIGFVIVVKGLGHLPDHILRGVTRNPKNT